MLAASQPIPIPGEPSIETLGQRPDERNREDPRDELSLRKLIDDLLDRRGALPRAAVATDELYRLRERAFGNPRKARVDAWRLRRDDLEHAVRVPFPEPPNESLADLARAVVDDRVRAIRRPERRARCAGRRRPSPFTVKRTTGTVCAGRRWHAAPGDDRGRAHAAWRIVTAGDCISVLCSGHSSATRCATRLRSAGSDGH